MCGQFGQSNLDKIINFNGVNFISLHKKINLSHLKNNYSAVIKPNQKAYILSYHFYQEAIFGFTKGENAKEEKRYWFNARVEYYNNKENDKAYNGPYLIFENEHLKSILHQKAVIPISHYIESPLGKPKSKFIIKPEQNKALFLGGIWFKQEEQLFFCILTTTANKVNSKINHKRSPVIVEEADLEDFLAPNTSKDQFEKYFSPNNNSDYEVFEIDPAQLKENNLFSVDQLEDFQPINNKEVVKA